MLFPPTTGPARTGFLVLLASTATPLLVAESPTGDSPTDQSRDLKRWTRFTVTASLPGSSWGTGGIAVADLDRDGDPDVVVSRRETRTAYWFERKDDATWDRHAIGTSESLERTLGSAALDMDLDGWTDIVFGGVWFRNPGTASIRSTPWRAVAYEGGGHDVVAADLSGDRIPDLVTYDGKTLLWFDPSRKLARAVIVEDRDEHGGLAPRGVGDLDGDGSADIVLAGIWLKNPGRGVGEWKRGSWPHKPVPKASYGISMRSWVADLNSDGHNDIVYSDCDTGFSHVYWVENRGRAESWTRHQLADPSGDARTGSFHSLGVGDLDGDGTLEVFAGEQEDPDTYMEAAGRLPMKPPGLKERGVIWARSKDPSAAYRPAVIHEDNPGWHDAVLVDVDGDGDLDIVTKIWNADGPSYPVTYWRNDIRR